MKVVDVVLIHPIPLNPRPDFGGLVVKNYWASFDFCCISVVASIMFTSVIISSFQF